MRKAALITALLSLLLLAMACTPRIYLWPTGQTASSQPSSSPGLSNPASVFCQQQSGRTQTRRNVLGQETSYCVFNDLSYCEEWSYYRSSCKPGDNKNFQ